MGGLSRRQACPTVLLNNPTSPLRPMQADLKSVCSRDAAINAQLQHEAAKLLPA